MGIRYADYYSIHRTGEASEREAEAQGIVVQEDRQGAGEGGEEEAVKPFMIAFDWNGNKWSVTLYAKDEPEAYAKVNALKATAEVLGEIKSGMNP